MWEEMRSVEGSEERRALNIWVAEQLVDLRTSVSLDVSALAGKIQMSVAGVRKMESKELSNPNIESLNKYVEACGKTIGEFFEPKIPPENPRYDRYVHKVVKAALQHPKTKTYLRSLVGLLSEAMKTGPAEIAEKGASEVKQQRTNAEDHRPEQPAQNLNVSPFKERRKADDPSRNQHRRITDEPPPPPGRSENKNPPG
jgi:transcriptional regulator with XRE-family HTH domain